MQVTNAQVAQSIEALKRQQPHGGPPLAIELGEVSDEVLAALEGVPELRRDRIEGVRSRLAEERLPTDDEVAEKLVARLVCDRLR